MREKCRARIPDDIWNVGGHSIKHKEIAKEHAKRLLSEKLIKKRIDWLKYVSIAIIFLVALIAWRIIK